MGDGSAGTSNLVGDFSRVTELMLTQLYGPIQAMYYDDFQLPVATIPVFQELLS